MQWLDIISKIGPLVTAAAVFVAVLTLRANTDALHANHDWYRRSFTASLIASWNAKTSMHRRTIEKLRPGLIDLDSSKDIKVIKVEDAVAIYDSHPNMPEWELRFHLIELLNELEDFAIAYYHGVADTAMMDKSLKRTLQQYHTIFQHFIELVERRRGFPTWCPYTELIADWKSPRERPWPHPDHQA